MPFQTLVNASPCVQRALSQRTESKEEVRGISRVVADSDRRCREPGGLPLLRGAGAVWWDRALNLWGLLQGLQRECQD